MKADPDTSVDVIQAPSYRMFRITFRGVKHAPYGQKPETLVRSHVTDEAGARALLEQLQAALTRV